MINYVLKEHNAASIKVRCLMRRSILGSTEQDAEPIRIQSAEQYWRYRCH